MVALVYYFVYRRRADKFKHSYSFSPMRNSQGFFALVKRIKNHQA